MDYNAPASMNHIALHLKDIHAGHMNGRLVVRKGDWERTLAFQDGGLIFAKTNVPGERLGEVLLKMGRISPEDAATIPSLTSSGRMIGEALIAKRLITHKDLYEALLAQMTQISLALFSVFDADFRFEARERIGEIDFELKMYVPQLLELGIREMEFPPAMIRFLGPKIPLPIGRDAVKSFGADEAKVWASLDGRRTAEDILASLAMEAKAFWKSLFLLYCLNLVELSEPELARTAEPGPAPEMPAKSDLPLEPAVAAENNTTIEEMVELYHRLPQLDYYQILGVGRAAEEEELKKAYFKLARKFHPDRFRRQADPEIRDKIDAVFDAVTKAYRTLASRDKRAMYASKMAGPAPAEEKDRGQNAELRFRQGKTLYSQGRYEEAQVLLEEVVRLKDDKGDYYLLLAMAESKVPSQSKKAERDFLRAIEIEPWNPEAYVGLGYLYKREGLTLRARKQFEKALEVDSEHKAARQGLDESGGKSGGKKSSKGLLSKDLFGGKKK